MERQEKKTMIVYGYIRSDIGYSYPPSEIAIEMMEWIYLYDSWDKLYTNPKIKISDNYPMNDNGHHIISTDKTFSDWFHAFGSFIVSKGNKEHWTLKLTDYYTSERMIGIIDNKYLSKQKIKKLIDFTNTECFGYGLSITSHYLYHINKSKYFKGFQQNVKFKKDSIITMELDLTQKKYGILRYYKGKYDQTQCHKIKNIAYDDIDINRKYRLCVALNCIQDGFTLIP